MMLSMVKNSERATMEQINVILVDENDNELGICEKLEAHEKALLHRAFSIFVLRGDLILMQKRAFGKYHSGGLWTNSCCSHPRPQKTLEASAKDALLHETGITFDGAFEHCGSFVYKAPFDNGLTEYELDHVLICDVKDDSYTLNPDEASEAKWMSVDEVALWLEKEPHVFTAWFALAFSKMKTVYNKRLAA